MACPVRTYPLRQPANHKPPVPRWHLVLEDHVKKVFTAYIGVQQHSPSQDADQAAAKAVGQIEAWITNEASNGPFAVEAFTVVDGDDVPDANVWVCYWADESHYHQSVNRISLPRVYTSLTPSEQKSVGLWCEHFSSDVSRLETNYSGLDYLPGLARLPHTTTKEHTLSAYWGAARDRIPESAYDRFERDHDTKTAPPSTVPASLGQYLVGSNYENLVHIRSGQFWEDCEKEESESYETKLEPTLRAGLAYLWGNPIETGTIGLRYLRNKDKLIDRGHLLGETCGAGFFRSLGDLEHWAEKHKSHLSIYLGAIKHAKVFGKDRKMRTWHEVSVLRQGEAHFEYVNCVPRTGAIRFIALNDRGN